MRGILVSMHVCVYGLLFLGTAVQFSTGIGQDETGYLLRQPVWVVLGIVLFETVSRWDYRRLFEVRWAWGLYLISVLLLLVVLIPGIGQVHNGARRWLWVGQPSELAKLSLLIVLARCCLTHRDQVVRSWKGLLRPAVLIGVVVGLVYREPDWGTAALLAMCGAVVLWVAGARLLFWSASVVVGFEMLVIALLRDPMRLHRVFAFLKPEEYRQTFAWQQWQSLVALGTGSWLGVGFANGRAKFGFLPEHHTDFILAVVGEEMGFVGVNLVLLGLATIVFGGFYISWKSRDDFGYLLGVGLTMLIGLQAIINIAVVTCSMPNKGIPLPFVSYGGSDLMAMMIAAGLLSSIGRYAIGSTPNADSEEKG